MQTILPLDEISHPTAKTPGMAVMAILAVMGAMGVMAAMAAMAAIAVVLSSTSIRDYTNRRICRQCMFGKNTECSVAVVQDKFGSISGLHPRRSSDQQLRRSSAQHRHHRDEFGSTSASSG